VLAAGDGEVHLGAGDDVVGATALTLAAGDVLDGGDGVDTLALGGGGLFDLSKLAGFDGFEQIVLADPGQVVLADGGSLALYGSAGADQVVLGAGADEVHLGSGDDVVLATLGSLNAGDVVDGGTGSDTLQLIGAGSLDLSALTGLSGFEHIALGDGGMSLKLLDGQGIAVDGGSGADTVLGGGGNEMISGAGGADVLRGGLGADTLIGGDGIDTASYEQSAVGVKLDLSTGIGSGGEAQGDVVRGIENILGSAFRDTLTGDTGANAIWGQGGNDVISGGAGADSLCGGAGSDAINGGSGDDLLNGGDGDDMLNGGAGRDLFTGGDGADRFVFGKGQSGAAAETRDVITDFSQAQGDLIDLSRFDANSSIASKQAFQFIGTAALGGHAGELHYCLSNGATVVEGDVNGDGHADFQLELTGSYTLTSSDFLL
jgi:Ca2+-binding RTX toxin-like protein